MKRMIGAALAAAGSLALAGGVLVAAAGPALAKVGNQAFGAAASGNLALDPVALATPDNTAAVAANANLAGLLATGAISDRADAQGATSQLTQGIVLTLPDNGSLTATGLRSWCLTSGSSTVGASNVYAGSIVQVGQSTIALPASPPPNDVITLPGSAGTITLNKQTKIGGLLSVDAVYASLPGQTVTLGASTCAGLVS